MHLTYAGLTVFILTALPLLALGRSIGADVLALSGGLFAMVLFTAGASAALWRLAKTKSPPTVTIQAVLTNPATTYGRAGRS